MRSIFHSLVLAPVVLAAAALIPNTAMAEASVVNVPFNFVVDGKVCPAGQYSVTRDPIRNTIFLSGQKAHVAFEWILTPGNDARQASNVTLRFDQVDQDFALQTVQYGRMTTYNLDHKTTHSAHDLERVVQGQ
jgi:hypothetical protein